MNIELEKISILKKYSPEAFNQINKNLAALDPIIEPIIAELKEQLINAIKNDDLAKEKELIEIRAHLLNLQTELNKIKNNLDTKHSQIENTNSIDKTNNSEHWLDINLEDKQPIALSFNNGQKMIHINKIEEIENNVSNWQEVLVQVVEYLYSIDRIKFNKLVNYINIFTELPQNNDVCYECANGMFLSLNFNILDTKRNIIRLLSFYEINPRNLLIYFADN